MLNDLLAENPDPGTQKGIPAENRITAGADAVAGILPSKTVQTGCGTVVMKKEVISASHTHRQGL